MTTSSRTMSNLDEITVEFQDAYDSNKSAKGTLDTKQQQMFSAFTQVLASGPLAQRSVPYPHGLWSTLTDEEKTAWVKKYYPGWKEVGFVDAPDGTLGGWLVIEEDPSLLKFTHVNHETGKVYGRTIVEGSPGLDDESLCAENPELWERITTWPEPWYSMVKTTVDRFTHCPWHPEAVDALIGEILSQHKVQRVVRDLDKLSNADLIDIQEYLCPGSVSVRLVPPRDAKPEELEEQIDQEDEL